MKPHPIMVLRERAEARAYLFHQCAEYDTIEQAIGPLLLYAEQHRLADNAVLAILDAAFKPGKPTP